MASEQKSVETSERIDPALLDVTRKHLTLTRQILTDFRDGKLSDIELHLNSVQAGKDHEREWTKVWNQLEALRFKQLRAERGY